MYNIGNIDNNLLLCSHLCTSLFFFPLWNYILVALNGTCVSHPPPPTIADVYFCAGGVCVGGGEALSKQTFSQAEGSVCCLGLSIGFCYITAISPCGKEN